MTNTPEQKNEDPEDIEETPDEEQADGEIDMDMDFEFSIEDDALSEDKNETGAEQNNEYEIKIETLEAELDRTKDQMMRALADAENTRKRLQKDRGDISKYAISSFARDLLDFADNFKRAMDALPKELIEEGDENIKNIMSGLEAMDRDMISTFEKHGIKKIEPLEEMFDPNFHEVMFEIPTSDSPAGTVIQIVEPGYILHDRLLRAARVAIAKSEGSDTSNNGDEPGSRVDQEA